MDTSARPPLDTATLRSLSPDVVTGLRVEVVDEAASTNTLVADRARGGEPDGLVVVTEHQTAGRGRLDRSWVTPARSGLTFSLLLRPSAPVATWPWLPLLAGYEVTKALSAAGYPAGVKWPNDVLIDDRKVAGILSEVVETSAGAAVVVGIGINVAMLQSELPVPTATSLLVAGGADRLPDRTDLLTLVLQTLWEGYQAWQAGGGPAAERLATSYAAACVTLGRQVRVERPAAPSITGTAAGIDAEGRLLVVGSDGADPVALSAGDVVHVRSD